MFKYLILVFFISAASGAVIGFCPIVPFPLPNFVKQCGANCGLIDVKIPECPNMNDVCLITAGKQINVSIEFKTGAILSNGYKLKLYALGQTIMDAEIPGNFLPNSAYTITFAINLSEDLIGVIITMGAKIEDIEQGLELFCFEFRVSVIPK